MSNTISGNGAAAQRGVTFAAASLFALLVFATPATLAQQPAQKPAAPPQPAGVRSPQGAQSAAAKYFTDVELVTHEGQTVRLYSDLLKDKVVVINAFFATCTGVCPPMNRNLEKVQEALKDRLGKDLFIISITVDPATDTPERLKAYAAQFRAVPGRLFVTGRKENVDWALYKLGQYVENKDSHTSVLVIGNERTGLWKKAFAMAKTDELVEIVRSVLDDKGAAN